MNEWATAWTITPVILRCGAELAQVIHLES